MSIIEAPQAHVKPSHHAPPASPPAPSEHQDDLPRDLRKPHPVVVAAVGLLFAALLAGLFFAGYLPHRRAQQLAETDAAAVSDSVNVVAVAHPRPAQGAKEILLPCDIRPFQDTLIYARASGYLKRLNVDIDDKVQKDQVLAEIDAPEIDAQLLQAQAALQQAHADVTKAQTDLDLAERSYQRYADTAKQSNDVSRQEMDERASARDQARAVLARGQASIAVAEADIQRLKVLQGFDKITAPFSGTITARNFDVGALLSPSGGREIFRLQQSDTLRVFVNVPQVYATQIRTGQEATLTVRNFGNRRFKGTVTRTAGAVNASTRTMPFELQFSNKDGVLVPGMYGQAQLAVDSPPQALLIPVSAMLFNATGTQVAVVREGTVHFQQVTLGRDLGTDMEVLDGLAASAQVITNPNERMSEGSAVKVAESLAAAQPK